MPPGVRRLVERLDDVPVGVFAADWTLLCWNTAWSALHGDPRALPAAERNLARALFGDGAARARMRAVRSERGDDAFAASLVADLKDAASCCPEDPELARLLRELRDVSPDFARLWSAPTAAAPHTTDRKTIRHPQAGDITLDCDVLLVPGADLRMVTYTAAAGSADALALDLLRATVGPATTTPSPTVRPDTDEFSTSVLR